MEKDSICCFAEKGLIKLVCLALKFDKNVNILTYIIHIKVCVCLLTKLSLFVLGPTVF